MAVVLIGSSLATAEPGEFLFFFFILNYFSFYFFFFRLVTIDPRSKKNLREYLYAPAKIVHVGISMGARETMRLNKGWGLWEDGTEKER